MNKVIEILDSDDSHDDQLSYAIPQNPEPAEKPEMILAPPDVTDEEIEPQKFAPTHITAELVEPTNEDGPSTSSSSLLINKGRTRNRRKSTHQLMRISPEIQFETIALDEDEEHSAKKERNASAYLQSGTIEQHKLVTYKTTPKILTIKPPTAYDLIQTAHEEFLNDSEIVSLTRRIAEERVRVNMLLAEYGMPDINFSLYTKPDRLQFQLKERLRQRKMCTWEPWRFQESK